MLEFSVDYKSVYWCIEFLSMPAVS